MSLVQLIIDLEDAKTLEDKARAQADFDARKAAEPSTVEVLTAFLRNCTDTAGAPILQPGEYADLDGSRLQIRNLQ